MDDFVASSPNSLPRQIAVDEFLLDRDTIRVWRKNKPLQLSMRQFRTSEIGRLRQAIGYRYGKNPIKTVRGVGFMFETEPSKARQYTHQLNLLRRTLTRRYRRPPSSPTR